MLLRPGVLWASVFGVVVLGCALGGHFWRSAVVMTRPGCSLCLGGAWLGRVEFFSFDREESESHERGSGFWGRWWNSGVGGGGRNRCVGVVLLSNVGTVYVDVVYVATDLF